MRRIRVWAGLLALGRVVVEGVYSGEEAEVVVAVRPRFRELGRCAVCWRRCTVPSCNANPTRLRSPRRLAISRLSASSRKNRSSSA